MIFSGQPVSLAGCCEACVYGSGDHNCDNKSPMTISEACSIACSMFGPIARVWDYDRPYAPYHEFRYEVGTGGAGMAHVVYGRGHTWEEAIEQARRANAAKSQLTDDDSEERQKQETETECHA